MLCFCFLAPLGDAVAKILGQHIPITQLLFVRFAVQSLILIPVVVITGRQWQVDARVMRLVLLRTGLHLSATASMITALKYLPLADAVAIAFVMPFLTLLLGKYVLNEQVGVRRFVACVVGFMGTLLVIQPSFAKVGALALLPLMVALTFALFMLVTRAISKDTDPIGLQAVSGLIATVILIPFLVVGQFTTLPALQFVIPDITIGSLLIFIGVLGTFAHLLMTWSLRYAPSATLAPLQYLEIPFATLIGWMVFGDLPNGLATIGILITVAAGLYIVIRERTMSRSVTPQKPQSQVPVSP